MYHSMFFFHQVHTKQILQLRILCTLRIHYRAVTCGSRIHVPAIYSGEFTLLSWLYNKNTESTKYPNRSEKSEQCVDNRVLWILHLWVFCSCENCIYPALLLIVNLSLFSSYTRIGMLSLFIPSPCSCTSAVKKMVVLSLICLLPHLICMTTSQIPTWTMNQCVWLLVEI